MQDRDHAVLPAPVPSSLSPADLPSLNAAFAQASPEAILRWAFHLWGDQLVLACSFGAEDVALLHLFSKVAAETHALPRAFVLDTGRLHEETYDVMERCRLRYKLSFETFFPDTASIEELLRKKGPHSFYESVEDRKECCNLRKVRPLQRALATAKAWITGLRRSQSVTRSDVPFLEEDASHPGLWKLNPLAAWSEEEVWSFLRREGVPTHALHDRGFPSIGCAPCTRAIEPGEDIRAGRWWWELPSQKECGLHKRP